MKAANLNWFLIDNKWHHCAVIQEGNEFKHYVDGEYTHSVCPPSHKERSCESMIFDRVLTEDEIKEIYNNGNGLEYPFEKIN
jgi:hypothetical protein